MCGAKVLAIFFCLLGVGGTYVTYNITCIYRLVEASGCTDSGYVLAHVCAHIAVCVCVSLSLSLFLSLFLSLSALSLSLSRSFFFFLSLSLSHRVSPCPTCPLSRHSR